MLDLCPFLLDIPVLPTANNLRREYPRLYVLVPKSIRRLYLTLRVDMHNMKYTKCLKLKL